MRGKFFSTKDKSKWEDSGLKMWGDEKDKTNLKAFSYMFQCLDGGVFRRRLKIKKEMERNVV